jgi:hypothetical protein
MLALLSICNLLTALLIFQVEQEIKKFIPRVMLILGTSTSIHKIELWLGKLGSTEKTTVQNLR